MPGNGFSKFFKLQNFWQAQSAKVDIMKGDLNLAEVPDQEFLTYHILAVH